MHNSLMALIAANRGKGRPLAVTTVGSEATVELYDVIVMSQADADWWGGGVGADAFARELRALEVDTIHLRINSPGGDVFAGVAMAQAIREQPATVIAHVDGYAASIASLVTVACDEAVIAPGGMLMVHKAWTIGFGNADDLTATAALLAKIDGDLCAAYAQRAGNDPADWMAAIAAETWYNADEAVAARLVDRIAEGATKKAAAQARAFDLSAYSNAPKPAAAPALDTAPIAEAIRLTAQAEIDRQAADEAAGQTAAHRARLHAMRMRSAA